MRINEPDVVFQQFPDEVVIINLREGTYYNTDGIGADIFGMIAAGADITQVRELLVARWDIEPSILNAVTEEFIFQLFNEGLVTGETSIPSTATEAFPARALQPFVVPSLNAHTDMQELLLLDPVHEVSEQGWPNRVAE